jgi:2-alkenal reductase
LDASLTAGVPNAGRDDGWLGEFYVTTRLNRIAGQLIKEGHVPIPGIGIVAASESTAAWLGIDGVIILRTLPGLPAAKAGLEGAADAGGVVADVITALNGEPVHDISDLATIFEQVGVGHTVNVTPARDGQSRTVGVGMSPVRCKGEMSGNYGRGR